MNPSSPHTKDSHDGDAVEQRGDLVQNVHNGDSLCGEAVGKLMGPCHVPQCRKCLVVNRTVDLVGSGES